jgi:O-antigen/teichoic acid export membrane protein
LHDAVVTFLIRVGGAGLAFGLQALLARLMAADAYGGYVIIWSWLLACGSFASLGLADSAVRFLPRYESRKRHGQVTAFFGFGFTAVGIAAAATAAAAVASLLALPVSNAVMISGVVIAAALPLLALETFFEGVARGLGWFRLTSVTVYIARPLLIAAACGGIHLSGIPLTLERAAAILIVALAATAAFLFVVIRSRLAARARKDRLSRRDARLWLKASLPMLLVSGLEDLFAASDVILIGFLISPEDAAVYFVAGRTLALAHFAQYAVQFVQGRRFSIALAQPGAPDVERHLQSATVATVVTTLAALAVTLAAGRWLLAVFGPDFAAAYTPMCILAAGLLARSLAGQSSELLLLSGHYRALIAVNATVIVVLAVFLVVLAPKMGIAGAATATAAALLVRSWLLVRTVKSALGRRVLPRLSWAAIVGRNPAAS